MSIPRFSKEFPTYEAADAWIEAHGIKAPVLEEMFPEGWLVTLEGAEAKRVLDVERPLAPGGFRLAIEEEAA